MKKNAPIVHEEEKRVCEGISRVGGGDGKGERRRKGRGRRWEAASSPGCAEVRWVGRSEQKST